MISIIIISTLLFAGIYALIRILTDNLEQYYYYHSKNLITEIIKDKRENDPFAKIIQIIDNAMKNYLQQIPLDTRANLEQIENILEIDEETIRLLEQYSSDDEISQCNSNKEILDQLYSD